MDDNKVFRLSRKRVCDHPPAENGAHILALTFPCKRQSQRGKNGFSRCFSTRLNVSYFPIVSLVNTRGRKKSILIFRINCD